MDELFGPEAYNATVTRGVVSTAERFIENVGHVQFDARVSPGNSGGPLLGADRRVIAIVTKGGTGRAEGYNFGILVDQLRDELAQWVGRKR
jgi:S1-C subfamily serine protease